MGRVFRRGSRWYIDFIDQTGERRKVSAAPTKGEAEKVLKEVEMAILARPPVAASAPILTLAEAAEEWHQRRKARGSRTSTNDRGYLNNHILPVFGHRAVGEIRVADVRRWVDDLCQKDIAPRTIRHIYAAMRKLYADLLVDEVVDRTPCVLGREHLPPDTDNDPEWRSTAVFGPAEVVVLITSEMIPDDRRMMYAILFFTGARLSEAIGLKWKDIEPAAPMRKLLIRRQTEGRATKTKVTRQIPIHPYLDRLLETWRHGGAARLLGRMPGHEDPLIPSRKDGRERDHFSVSRRRVHDLARLGLRPRRLHDTRRTFVTQARAGGARPDVLRVLTHTSSRDMMDIYTSLPWATLCDAVMCLKYEVASGQPDDDGTVAHLVAQALTSPDGE